MNLRGYFNEAFKKKKTAANFHMDKRFFLYYGSDGFVCHRWGGYESSRQSVCLRKDTVYIPVSADHGLLNAAGYNSPHFSRTVY